MRNPKWNRDELILALDLYFKKEEALGNKDHPEIAKLSEILKKLNSVLGVNITETLRNTNGVYMKLMNIRSLDPNYSGQGLKAGGSLEKELWNYFYPDRLEELKKMAIKIKEALKNSNDIFEYARSSEELEEANEGRLLTRIHLIRERNRSIVKKKKNQMLSQLGSLRCEVCKFDFNDKYGEIGFGFAECHHKIPLSELNIDQKTRLSDLSILCSNCHRMIHRRKPWLTIEELSEIYDNNNL